MTVNKKFKFVKQNCTYTNNGETFVFILLANLTKNVIIYEKIEKWEID